MCAGVAARQLLAQHSSRGLHVGSHEGEAEAPAGGSHAAPQPQGGGEIFGAGVTSAIGEGKMAKIGAWCWAGSNGTTSD